MGLKTWGGRPPGKDRTTVKREKETREKKKKGKMGKSDITNADEIHGGCLGRGSTASGSSQHGRRKKIRKEEKSQRKARGRRRDGEMAALVHVRGTLHFFSRGLAHSHQHCEQGRQTTMGRGDAGRGTNLLCTELGLSRYPKRVDPTVTGECPTALPLTSAGSISGGERGKRRTQRIPREIILGPALLR